jgi:hypothetical protein
LHTEKRFGVLGGRTGLELWSNGAQDALQNLRQRQRRIGKPVHRDAAGGGVAAALAQVKAAVTRRAGAQLALERYLT